MSDNSSIRIPLSTTTRAFYRGVQAGENASKTLAEQTVATTSHEQRLATYWLRVGASWQEWLGTEANEEEQDAFLEGARTRSPHDASLLKLSILHLVGVDPEDEDMEQEAVREKVAKVLLKLGQNLDVVPTDRVHVLRDWDAPYPEIATIELNI